MYFFKTPALPTFVPSNETMMKNFRKILIAILVFPFAFGHLGAQGWERAYDLNGSGNPISLFQTNQGGFLFAASLRRNTSQDSDIAFIQTDVNGDTLLTKRIFTNGTSKDLYHIKKDSIGNFFILGSVTYSQNSADRDILVIKTDSIGDTIWTSELDIATTSRAFLSPLSDGGVFIAASLENPVSTQGALDVFFSRIDEQGDTLWTSAIIDTSYNQVLSSVAIAPDGNFLLFSFIYPPGNTVNNSDLLLTKISADGDTIWQKTHDLGGTNFSGQIIPLPNDSSFMAFQLGSSPKLIKFDKHGEIVSTNILEGLTTNNPAHNAMVETTDSGFLLAGKNNQGKLFVIKTDSIGEIEWHKRYGQNNDQVNVKSVLEMENGKYAFLTEKLYGTSPFGADIYLIVTDSIGNSFTNHLQGNIFYDSLAICSFDSLEMPLEGWSISAKGDDRTYFGSTDTQGNYDILTDTGTYTLHLNIPNAYWSSCWNDSIVSMTNFFDTVTVDFPVKAEHNCPIINVDVSTPFLRRCYPNTYYVSYCNEGTVPEGSAYIEVNFDEWLTVDSSSLAWSSQDGQTFTFEIDTLDVGECGGFQVYTTLDCDSTMLGQTHCVTAHSYPDSICLLPGTQWDGSTVAVEGFCENDTIEFTIRNTGDNDMSQPLNYIVIEDHILHLNGSFQLLKGDSTKEVIGATGKTYRMEAEQSAFHPTNSAPSVTVEGCANGMQPISFGFFGAYSEDDADPFISMDCQQNIGSFDPNDKQGFPKGIGPDHIIFHDTELEYLIRFQNTGTDTAFKVVLRDTLSEFLDPASVVPGASSHPYTWELRNNGALKFTFNDILLVDSNANEPASHGFVKFKIKQQPGNLPGTVIYNQAAIYFDFNAPVITNQTDHKIDDRPLIVDSLTLYFCDQETYQQDTVIHSSGSTLSFHFETTNNIIIASPQMTIIDTTLLEGDSLFGVAYEANDTLTQQFVSIAGCDSTVTIHIEVMPNSTGSLEWLGAKVSAYPNPSSGEVNLSIGLPEKTEMKIEVLTQLGQPIQTLPNQPYSSGNQIFPISLTGLPNGIYWVRFNSPKGTLVVKLVKT